ncbi:hypothetical protein CRG98_004370 [Punica granatum]|uniref:WRKY domain-containing protein n=2 Tax=Punica granatum TaxID=22663 RepID=A0A2I0L3D2_PUNGR|nr:hypothetical protein CRG98_004370 [Punica granatum]
MDGYTIGDLTDIVRASGGGSGPSNKSSMVAEELVSISTDSWQFPANSRGNSNIDNSVSIIPPSSSMEESFGDPFSDMRDPLLHHGLETIFFNSSSSSTASPVEVIDAACRDDVFVPNMFTRMLQMSAPDANPGHHQLPISPRCQSPVVAASSLMKEIKINSSSPALVAHHHQVDGSMNRSKSKGCLMESTAIQISSPGNSGIKRRKSQAKKVVCIPAPAAANSRASGEVVPSDLWAWRKYGQKPIKGSPYPRGYYRCSSSKGCSARKQVERSRTDPNMLVITYTSEHNHPWPTQRNALAGSTRSQPSKSNGSSAANTLKGAQVNPHPQKEAMAVMKEQKKDTDTASSVNTTALVKEEIEDVERHMEIEGGQEFSAEFSNSYRPSEPEEASRSDDFFADLGEIDGDPLSLLFNHGFGGDGGKDTKGLDPFGIFDWSEEQNPPFGVK